MKLQTVNTRKSIYYRNENSVDLGGHQGFFLTSSCAYETEY